MTSQLTVADLVKLEKAGGVISEGMYMHGITPGESVESWQEKMPLIDKEIVRRWHNFCEAKKEFLDILIPML